VSEALWLMSGARRVVPRRVRDAGSRGAVEQPRSRRHSTSRGGGSRVRPCPNCAAVPGKSCRTPSGREASRIHEARLRPGRHELLARDHVWAELERRGATIATVPFSGRAGRGGTVERIVLNRLQGDELIDVGRWSGRDELCYALEAPIWDRFGSFAGQPLIVGTVIWTTADRRVVIEGRRGNTRFEELV
jgi:hypothetical protein